jgi:hypothetical protein
MFFVEMAITMAVPSSYLGSYSPVLATEISSLALAVSKNDLCRNYLKRV